jgi:AhpD family alkylhydroperoxidase
LVLFLLQADPESETPTIALAIVGVSKIACVSCLESHTHVANGKALEMPNRLAAAHHY